MPAVDFWAVAPALECLCLCVFQVSVGSFCDIPCTSPIAARLMYSQSKESMFSTILVRDT